MGAQYRPRRGAPKDELKWPAAANNLIRFPVSPNGKAGAGMVPPTLAHSIILRLAGYPGSTHGVRRKIKGWPPRRPWLL
jgi:hypothetical protein